MAKPSECTIINASSFPEFFYKDSGIQVSAGQPVGVEIESANTVDFFLYDYIYWNPLFNSEDCVDE
jgi:hypothetical protein